MRPRPPGGRSSCLAAAEEPRLALRVGGDTGVELQPGTTFVIGGRLPALGAITPRSVIGVKANAGSPGSELLAGVVSGLLVVRSVAREAVDVREARPESFEHVGACDGRAGGKGNEKKKQCCGSGSTWT